MSSFHLVLLSFSSVGAMCGVYTLQGAIELHYSICFLRMLKTSSVS